MPAAETAGEVPEALLKIKDAFEVFESQSSLLQTSYDALKRDLAVSNRRLQEKNKALSANVAELQKLSSRFQCILESLTDGVLVVDTGLRVERCNRAVEALLDRSRRRIEGRLYKQITNGLGNAGMLESAISDGRTFLDDQRSSGKPRADRIHVLASVAPIRSQSGAIVGAVEILRDVTKLRFLEERVNSQKQMAALGEMAAMVAHEIRNPLGTIEGFARLLRRDLEESADHCRLAGKIVEAAENLNYVVTNLLCYARPMSLNCEMFDAATLLEAVRDTLEETARNAGAQLEVARPAGGLSIDGDIRQLRQVLLNLCTNAIEACVSKRKGKRRRAGAAASGHVRVSAGCEDGKRILTVADDGCGIPKEDIRRIFNPFFTRREGGTGLGLSLCHKIVTAHGGEIAVESVCGEGTVFKVILP